MGDYQTMVEEFRDPDEALICAVAAASRLRTLLLLVCPQDKYPVIEAAIMHTEWLDAAPYRPAKRTP